MDSNSQSRKWTLVLNNPIESAGLDHEAITEILKAIFARLFLYGR